MQRFEDRPEPFMSPGLDMHRRRNGWRRELLIVGFFTFLAVLFYGPILMGLRAFPDGDFVHHFFPFSLFQYQAIADGRLAVWNPYTYSGHPFLADVQAAVFYPISNLFYLLTLSVTDVAARFYWLQVEAVLHTALAGIFAYLWTRELTASRWGGVVGGIAFALSGFVTGYAPLQLAVLRTAVWLPLLLWCLARGWQEPGRWRWWMGSLAALSFAFLAGHSQSFMLLVYAMAAWIICLAVVHRRYFVVAALSTVVTGLAAIGLTAAQWLPSVEFVRQSVRANVDYDFVGGGLALADFWQLLLPGVLTYYSPLYIGVVGAVLAMVAIYTFVFSRRAAPERMLSGRMPSGRMPEGVGIAFCLGLALFALLASLGANGPLFPILYRVAPGWGWFRGQERSAFLVAVGLSGLAAYGMAAISKLPPPTRRRAGFLAGAVVVAVVYAFGLLWQLAGRTSVDHAGYLLTAGVTLLLGLAMAWMVAMPGWSEKRNAWTVALVVVNLVWANTGINQLAGTPSDRVRVAPEISAVMEAVAERPEVSNGVPGRVYNEFRAYDDYGMRAEVEDVWGSSPLRVARYAALFESFPLDRMWRLLGVQYVLTWRRELFGPSDLLAEFPQPADTTYLHRLPDVNPRAWFVSDVSVVDDERAWSLLADHQFDLGENAVVGLEYGGIFDGTASTSADTPATILFARRAPESFDVTIQTAADGMLVVSEIWLPGWEVTDVRCASGEICPAEDEQGRAYFMPMRVDLTLVGIWLPAGDHRFSLRYRPLSVRLGLWISGGTLLLLFGAGLWHWRRKMRAAP